MGKMTSQKCDRHFLQAVIFRKVLTEKLKILPTKAWTMKNQVSF